VTRREHYEEAERLLTEATSVYWASKEGGFTDSAARLAEANVIERAQAHALLAGVSAEAAGEKTPQVGYA
jgi:hypothetical protein